MRERPPIPRPEGLEATLTRPSTLAASLVAYLGLSGAFLVVMLVWDFQVIDEVFRRDAILAHVEAMTAEQRRVHAITTATLDVAYPFAYGAFQAGMAYRYLGRWGRWIAPLSLLCIPVDLLEGLAQVLILTGSEGFVGLKTVVTPLKLGLYLPGLAGALAAAAIALRRRLRARSASPP